MSKITSKSIESRYISSLDDGLPEIFVGLSILVASVFLWTGMVWMVGIFLPLFFPAFREARRQLLKPRIKNNDKFTSQQTQALKQLFLLTTLVGVLFLLLIGLFSVSDILSNKIIDLMRSNFLLITGFMFSLLWIFRCLRENFFIADERFIWPYMGTAHPSKSSEAI